MAAAKLRRHCREHPCEGEGDGWMEAECGHVQHRENVDFVKNMLARLGLPVDYIEVTEEHRQSLMKALKNIPALDIHSLGKDVVG